MTQKQYDQAAPILAMFHINATETRPNRWVLFLTREHERIQLANNLTIAQMLVWLDGYQQGRFA